MITKEGIYTQEAYGGYLIHYKLDGMIIDFLYKVRNKERRISSTILLLNFKINGGIKDE